MSKNKHRENKNTDRNVAAAPSGEVDTSSNTSPSGEVDGNVSEPSKLESARAARQEQMKVSPKPDAAKAAKPEKVPSFVANVARRAELFAMSDEELLAQAKDKMRAIDFNNRDIYGTTGNRQDGQNGQDISRSGIRSEILAFLESRKDQQAPANVICAYMTLAAGESNVGTYRGKIDFSYITTKDAEAGKRGMVARKQLRLVARAEPAKAPVAEAAAPETAPAS